MFCKQNFTFAITAVICSQDGGPEAQVWEMVALLLARGADPTVECRGRDALGWARFYGLATVVELLEAEG